jgi:hypothetical protein
MNFSVVFWILVIVGLPLWGYYWFTDNSWDSKPVSEQIADGIVDRLFVIERKIAQWADFTHAVSQVESAVTRRAQEEALASINELDALLARYKAAGKLPPDLEADLEAFMVRNAGAFVGLSDDVGWALARLIARYAPPGGRLQYWLETKALPRVREKSREEE